eukprot:4948083-Pyramimonas_sp.AAC.1
MWANKGLVAGCPFTTTFRVNSLEGLDSIVWHPCVDYSLYVDDNGIHAVGGFKEVLEGVVQGSEQLVRVISEDIGAS